MVRDTLRKQQARSLCRIGADDSRRNRREWSFCLNTAHGKLLGSVQLSHILARSNLSALEVKPGKVHKSELDFDLHLRQVRVSALANPRAHLALQAALGAAAKAGERVVLSVHTEEKAFVLGSLRAEHCEQIPLDLHFRAGENVRAQPLLLVFCPILRTPSSHLTCCQVGFSVSGSASVHLTGNMIPDIASEYARTLLHSLAQPVASCI